MSAAGRESELERGLREALARVAADEDEPTRLALRDLLTRDPASATAWNALGALHRKVGALEAAQACFARAATLAPHLAPAHLNLGLVLGARGRHAAAEAAYTQALSIVPGWAQAERVLAASLLGQDRVPEAEAAARRAAAREADAPTLGPLLASILVRKAERLRAARRHGAALEALSEATAHHPRCPGLPALHHAVAREACAWDEAARLAADLVQQAREGGDPSVLAPDVVTWNTDASLHLQVAQRWVAEATAGIAALAPQPPAAGRLHVGYLSADYRDHATWQLVAGVFGRHDRARVRVTAYALGPPDTSGARQHLARDVEHLVDLEGLTDAQAAQRIRADGVHVLVDLKGLTAGARPGILAHRPAPVQATWLGYPGSTGAPFIDYLLGDAVVTPTAHEAVFRECVVRLPHSYQVTDEDAAIAPWPTQRAEVGLPPQAIVLACFAHPHKITHEVFQGWLGLLRQEPSVVLWLYQHNTEATDRLRHEAVACGVDPARLHFAAWCPKPAHLARLRLADLVLDTLPCNGHTTTSDALRAGVPVLTARGTHFAGRVSESLLRAVGLPDGVAADFPDLLARARVLVSDPVARGALRARLAAAWPTAPLFDTGRTVRALEAAYEAMWARHAGGLPPAAIDVHDPGPTPGRAHLG